MWLVLTTTVQGQVLDPIPDLPVGPWLVRLTEFARGIPVEQEFITPVFTQRVGPTDLTMVPGNVGNMVVTSYGGQARLFGPQGELFSPLFLDLMSGSSPTFNPRFEFGGAHGLTTIAFHPDFAMPGKPGVGKFYTIEPESSGSGVADFSQSVRPGNHHQDVLYEYTLQDFAASFCDVACAQTKRELLRVTQPGWHHNLGDLLFADNGDLYIASGDGSVAGFVPPFISDNSQRRDNVFGKVLRINPLGANSANGNYGIPADNPFRDGPGPWIDEIYAWGFRNPFRLEWDSATGHLYASETGENRVEAVEQVVAGGNYGWNDMEGSFRYDKSTRHIQVDVDLDGNGVGDFAELKSYRLPVLEYDRSEGRAIVGAVPYRGTEIPWLAGHLVLGDFSGKLFFGDPATGTLHQLHHDHAGATMLDAIHSVNVGPDGEIFLLGTSRTSEGQHDGRILRLQAAPATNGDFNFDGQLDVHDMDLLTQQVRAAKQNPLFDVSQDGVVDAIDRETWVEQLRGTFFGDANLDGVFSTADLVLVWNAGQYEDAIPNNSGWATGDWNGDGDFTTNDLVVALTHGGYEQGPRVSSMVPEPSSQAVGWIISAWVIFKSGRRRAVPPPEKR
jgi:hypothetical protein